MRLRREAHFGNRVIRCFAERPASVVAKLMETFARHSEREAVVDGYRRLTYGQLDARIAAAAGLLQARGLRAGDRLGVVVPNRAEFVITVLAIMRLGAIPVPMNVREAAPEIGFILDDCSASGLIYDPACDAADRVAGTLGTSSWSLTIGEIWEAPAAGAAWDAPAQLDEDATACIVYTSGTTGRPKGAMLSGLGVLHSMLHYEAHLGLTCEDTALLVVPATHITGLIGLVMAALGVGAKLVMMEQFNTAEFVRIAAVEAMSYTILVPAMYNLLLLREDLSAHALSHWRIGAYGGAVMPVASIAKLAQLLPGLNLVNAYGATETTSPTTLMPLGAEPALFDTIGKPVACAEVLIMDDDGRECPLGKIGELWIRGPMVVPGYWNRPVENAKDFTAGYWHSGDIGEVTPEGYLRIHDRRKDLVNRGGYKIFSAEVEHVLMAHPDVIEAAVVGRPDPVLGERVHAFIVAERQGLSSETLRAFCARELADYKVPETFTLTSAALPRNANGKILKRQLKEMLS
ncbi:hypothetical protein CG51_12820 [Haematobacter missouriensis]|uniref:O-succinylbenzoic acid--CoA ligase n=1 Tax=Haematobacter missouriensis TaxID=366616 RepID=A0ABX3ZUK3_9RHOB|nr:class I adenylate-forming enzyme family protein [Haematobacter missouriensis]KFI25864.1 hypothetical protein CG51_12820 [Haematobacter missouriensis]OWJ77088.1 O-succinylbenzoic acid--CoA ligase [Haematobacter missouriensis]